MSRIGWKRRREQIRLKAHIASQMRMFHPQMRKTLVANIAELVAAVTQARHVHLAKIAEKLDRDGNEESREQWVRRQLANDTLGTWEIFEPLARCLLNGFVGQSVSLLLDPTDLDAEHCTVRIMLAYRGRAWPLIWMSFELKPGAIEDTVTLLFAELRRWLPEGIKVYLAADREFHGVDMLALICAQGWIPVVRGKGTTGVTLADGSQQPLNDLTPPVGQSPLLVGG